MTIISTCRDPALAADKSLAPFRNRRFGAVALGYLGRVRFNLTMAIETPDDQPHDSDLEFDAASTTAHLLDELAF